MKYFLVTTGIVLVAFVINEIIWGGIAVSVALGMGSFFGKSDKKGQPPRTPADE